MSKTSKRLISLLLAFVMVLCSTVFNTNVVRADEEDDYDDDYIAELMEGDDAPDDPDEINIDVSQRIVSFGHVSRGNPVGVEAVTVTSYSSRTIHLDYQLCDAEDIFYISTSDSMSLAPGQSATFYIGMDEDKPEGYYSATLILCPLSFYGATVNVGINAEILEPRPTITYIDVNPHSVDMAKDSSYRFSADVRGTNNPDYSVKWSVEGNKSSGTTVDGDGYLKIDPNESASRISVRATSCQDSNWSSTAEINIKEGNYRVNTSSSPSSGGTTAGGGSFSPGSTVEVYAAPNNGYRFIRWSKNGQTVSNNSKYQINNIRDNYDLTAEFEQVNCYVRVGTTHPEGGSVSGSGNVNYNGSYNLMATPKNGFVFEGWYEDGKKISDKAALTINNIVSNREFNANFVKNVFQVQTLANPQGAGIVNGTGSYSRGSTVSVNAKAIDGYAFDCWTFNGNLVSRDAAFAIANIDKDYNLVANFKKKDAVTYTINSKIDGGQGAVTPAGAVSVPEGMDVTYSFVPAKNYTISYVSIDGKSVGIVPSYTFKKINGNHTVSVKFVEIVDSDIHKEKKPVEKKQEKAEASEIKPEEPEEIIDNDEEMKEIEPEAVDNFLQYTELTGILQECNISEDEARSLIRNGLDMQLLEMACERQYLEVSVGNEYADIQRETESKSFMNLSSTPNFADVVDSLLTEDEKMEVLRGGRVAINFNLFANNKLETGENKLLTNRAIKDKVEIGNFFEAILIKHGDRGDEVITELDVPMQIVLNIPQNLKSEGREFYIMRAHKEEDGSVTIDYLKNESTDPSKISFTTSKFSSYAIAYRGGKSTGLTQSDCVKILFVAFVIAVILTIVLIIVLVRISKKAKRKKYIKQHEHN